MNCKPKPLPKPMLIRGGDYHPCLQTCKQLFVYKQVLKQVARRRRQKEKICYLISYALCGPARPWRRELPPSDQPAQSIQTRRLNEPSKAQPRYFKSPLHGEWVCVCVAFILRLQRAAQSRLHQPRSREISRNELQYKSLSETYAKSMFLYYFCAFVWGGLSTPVYMLVNTYLFIRMFCKLSPSEPGQYACSFPSLFPLLRVNECARCFCSSSITFSIASTWYWGEFLWLF